MLNHIKAVIFDMDGLMLDSEKLVQEAWTLAGNELGYQDLGTNIYETLGLNVVKREIYFKQKYGSIFPFEEFQEHNRAAFRRLVAEKGLHAKPGLTELLRLLQAKKIKMAVATSSREQYARECLSKIGALTFMDAVVYGGMVARGKPEPDIYLLTCGLLDERPEHCLVLEDAPNGVRAACAAGMCTIMIPDLVQPDEELLQMIYAKKESLYDILPLFSDQN